MNPKNTREGNPQIFQVEKILQRGKAGDQVYYLVKWKGYSEAECTWEPQTNLEGCKQAILEFEERVKLYQTHQLGSSKKGTLSRDSKNKLSLQSSNKSLQKSPKNRTKKPKSMNPPILGSKAFPSKVKVVENTDSSKIFEQLPCQRVDKQEINKNIELQKGKDASIFQGQQRQEKIVESESEHESLEATTAQTIPPKDNQVPSNVSSELRTPFKASTIQSEIKKLISNAQKDSVEPEKVLNFPSAKINSLAKEKNACIDPLMKREKPFEQKSIDKKNESIRKKIKQQTAMEPQIKSEKQGGRNMSDLQLQKCNTSSNKERIKKQKMQLAGPKFGQSENEKSGLLSGNQGSAKEKKTRKEKSRRYLLCEQYLQDLKTQIIEDLCTSDQNSDETGKSSTREILLTRFIDATQLNAKYLNQKLLNKVLSRTEVDRLDKEGEFLDSKIKMLLKVKCEDNDTSSDHWVCVIEKKSLDEDRLELLGSKYLVNMEDFKEDVWRRMFRKLTLCHQN